MILQRVVVVAAAMSATVAVLASTEVGGDDARRTAGVLGAVDAVVLNFALKDVEVVSLIFVVGIKGNAVVVEVAEASGAVPKEAGGPSWAARTHVGDCVRGPRA